MARKSLQGSDGRGWEVHSWINWSQPATEDEFDHDMAAGYVSGIVMLVVIVALVLFVVFWTPSGVFVPSWLVLLFLLLLMVLPMQWAMRRPWTIEARTDDSVATSGERWVGTIHGVREARYETRQVIRNLRQRSNPDDGTGLLRQVM